MWGVFCLAALGGALGMKVYQEMRRYTNAKNQEVELPVESKSPPLLWQVRKNLIKDLWMNKEGKRLHHQMRSQRALLRLVPKKARYGIFEELTAIQGAMQEEVGEGKDGELWQRVRFFDAERGVYDYRAHTFFSPLLSVALAKVAGDILPGSAKEVKKIALQGVMKEVLFSFTAPVIALEADRVKMQMESEKKL